MLNLEVDILMDPLGVMDRMKRLCREKDISVLGRRNVTPGPRLTYLNLTQTETDLTWGRSGSSLQWRKSKAKCPTSPLSPELEHYLKHPDSPLTALTHFLNIKYVLELPEVSDTECNSHYHYQ